MIKVDLMGGVRETVIFRIGKKFWIKSKMKEFL